MKKTLSELAEFALGVSRKKFSGLSSKKQHEIIAALAYSCSETGSYDLFIKRYNQLQSWTELDRFDAPQWLKAKEALAEYHLFHKSFSPQSKGAEEKEEERPTWQPAFDVRVFMDQVRSPFNAGSVLRLIDNFGFRGLIHASRTLDFSHPRLKKAARGSERWLPVNYTPDPVCFLAEAEVPVIGIEKRDGALSLFEWEPPESCILVVGNEEYGISEAILKCCTTTVQIPMFGFKKSMNLHHALAVVANKFVEKNRLDYKD